LQCNLGATPGRVIIVRLYECDPAGKAPKVVKKFEQKSGNLWWHKSGAIKKSWGRLKLGTGIRYVMTVEPKGGRKTQITYNNVSGQTPKILGTGEVHPTFKEDPLKTPYATGRASTAAAFRLPSNVSLHDD
ncbi:MAG: hypothetical protein KDM64_18415, partial [Verrucomicrobiae bacterium]|nr:hypothetical protein [Verrucomicrobiae bacterium]